MLIEASDSAPDELAADFLRFFQIDDWTVLPMRRAASLCAALVRQPESWTFRKIVPDWQWSLLGNQLAAGIFDDLALAPAVGTGLAHGEEALAHLHLTCAMTRRAGLGLSSGLSA